MPEVVRHCGKTKCFRNDRAIAYMQIHSSYDCVHSTLQNQNSQNPCIERGGVPKVPLLAKDLLAINGH